ncbi:MAG: DUF2853 family protein [Gammaproteobacteria bacterium]
MSDYGDKLAKYTKNVDEDVVTKIVKHLGIALRNKDSSLVSGTDQKELDRVRESWLKKKLGRKESDDDLNAAIDDVVEKMGRSNPSKCRVCFYYLLAENYGVLGDL